MSFFRTIFVVMFLLCVTQANAAVVVGKDYKLLDTPQPTSSSKIEVLEFFFYECPHCYHLQGPLGKWEKVMPKDVDLEFVPVIFRESAEPLARTYYALQTMGQSARLHNDIFEALHVFNMDLSDERKITEFVAKHGVDTKKFAAAYNSFSIASKLNRSEQMVRDYSVHGTPTIVVDGKYTISELQPDETVRVLKEVVEIARKERRAGSH